MTAVPVVSATLTTRTVPSCEGGLHNKMPCWHTGERLVVDPVFVVLPEAPDLTGSPVYAATWQVWNGEDEPAHWYTPGAPLPANIITAFPHEHRQVVEWRATDVTVLPVVKSAADAEAAPFIHLAAHSGYPTLVETNDPLVWPTWMTRQPWAQNLRPGQFVLRLSGWEHLEQPHTEQGEQWEGDGELYLDVRPLSVPDGVLSWIELA